MSDQITLENYLNFTPVLRREDNDLTCPYCRHPHQYGYEAGDEGEYECAYCEKVFSYRVEVDIKYTSWAKEEASNE